MVRNCSDQANSHIKWVHARHIFDSGDDIVEVKDPKAAEGDDGTDAYFRMTRTGWLVQKYKD
jgi:hypothetical protein